MLRVPKGPRYCYGGTLPQIIVVIPNIETLQLGPFVGVEVAFKVTMRVFLLRGSTRQGEYVVLGTSGILKALQVKVCL